MTIIIIKITNMKKIFIRNLILFHKINIITIKKVIMIMLENKYAHNITKRKYIINRGIIFNLRVTKKIGMNKK